MTKKEYKELLADKYKAWEEEKIIGCPLTKEEVEELKKKGIIKEK